MLAVPVRIFAPDYYRAASALRSHIYNLRVRLAPQSANSKMNIPRLLTLFLLLIVASNVQAQDNYGGEIVSYNTFGEGMMVTRAKIVPLSGTVSNMFFFNRADEPWNNGTWYEYDWEIRGAYPFSGWSQIRVKDQGDTVLKDAPVDVSTTSNLGNELLHYILIRKDNRYIYDIRRNFNANTYNYNSAEAHSGNSASLLSNGPRVYETGEKLRHIPSWKQLDFSLGVTAFDTKWTESLPNGEYSREMEVDFTRFYTYANDMWNTSPQWSDEFDGISLDYGKWYTANWTYSATQFRQENVKVQGGRLYLRVNRGESYWDPSATINSVNVAQLDSVSQSTQSRPEVQVEGNTSDTDLDTAVSAESRDSAQTESEVTAQTESRHSVQTGSTDPVTLWILAAGGLLLAQRRRLN